MNLVVLLALCLAAFAASAQTMYKWVDEKGTTHFSEDPPPDGKATKVEVKPVAPGTQRSDEWRQRELESRQRRAEKEGVEAQSRGRDQAQRAQRCRYARRELDLLKNTNRVYSLNNKGERVYMEDQDRPVEIEKWTREADRNCD
jgi:hypothetical protein